MSKRAKRQTASTEKSSSIPTSSTEPEPINLKTVDKSAFKKVHGSHPHHTVHQTTVPKQKIKQLLNQEKNLMAEKLPPLTPTFWNIDSPPSLKPAKKFCDLTGLPYYYTDPKTGLRYYNSHVFAVIRNLPNHVIESYLALRKANAIIK